MKIFTQELVTRHRANVRRLFERHKAGIGYAVLTVGVIVALALGGKAIREADFRTEVQAAIICQNTVRSDRQQLSNLYSKSGHELFKSFHLTVPQAKALIRKQLVISAESRRALQPSRPRSACSGKLTTLSPAEVKAAVPPRAPVGR